MQALADVLRRFVAAKNGLLLPEGSFTRANVVVKDGARSDERFVLESHMGGTKLRIFSHRCVIRGLVEFDAMRRRQSVRSVRDQIHDAEIRKAAFALQEHKGSLENFHASEHDSRAIGNASAP